MPKVERSVERSPAASATRTSLAAIESVFARRDFCERALADARTSANPGHPADTCDKIAEPRLDPDGPVPKRNIRASVFYCDGHSGREPRELDADRSCGLDDPCGVRRAKGRDFLAKIVALLVVTKGVGPGGVALQAESSGKFLQVFDFQVKVL